MNSCTALFNCPVKRGGYAEERVAQGLGDDVELGIQSRERDEPAVKPWAVNPPYRRSRSMHVLITSNCKKGRTACRLTKLKKKDNTTQKLTEELA